MYINLIITTWKHFGTNNVVRILVLLPVAALHQILCSFVLKIKEIKISMGHSYVGTMIRFWDSAHKYIDSDRHQGVLFFPLASMLYLFPIFHQYQVEFHFRKKKVWQYVTENNWSLLLIISNHFHSWLQLLYHSRRCIEI